MEQLEAIDRSIFLFLNGLNALWLDTPMWYISSVIFWLPLFLFFVYYAYHKGKTKGILWLTVGCAVCIALADITSVHLFKNIFQRVRPTHNLEIMDAVHTVIKPNGEEYRGGLFSFVSSHAANFFALATFIFIQFKSYSNWWILLFFWAALISYSRIYLGVHYPSDLFCGGILGITIGIFVYRLSLLLDLKKLNHE